LYAYEGKLKYCYNFFGIDRYFAVSRGKIPAGDHQVRMEFAYDGGGLAKGGNVTLYVDGKAVGKGRVERSIPMGFSADEGVEIGSDRGSPSSPDYGPSANEFNGQIKWVQVDLGTDDHDHLISPEERFRLAMAKQ
jgi:arylsulfatase